MWAEELREGSMVADLCTFVGASSRGCTREKEREREREGEAPSAGPQADYGSNTTTEQQRLPNPAALSYNAKDETLNCSPLHTPMVMIGRKYSCCVVM